MDPSPNTPEDEPPKWRGRVEVLLLVAGGLVLLIPTLAIFSLVENDAQVNLSPAAFIGHLSTSFLSSRSGA